MPVAVAATPVGVLGWLALLRTPLGTRARFALLRQFPEPVEIWSPAGRRAMQGCPKLLAATGSVRWDRVEADRRWLAERTGARLVRWPDAAYPARLRELEDPPVALFVEGTPGVVGPSAGAAPDLAPERAIAIVGSRRASVGGRRAAFDLARGLGAAGWTVVSGLAAGIDTEAHRGALDSGGRTIAVLGAGLGRIYPRANAGLARSVAGAGALVTEYAPDEPPLGRNFPVRNRLISGLGLGVIVVEAAARSGSLITARLALEQGRDVFAVPGSIYNPLTRGCHTLLRQGAGLVGSVEDVLEEIGPPGPAAVPPGAAGEPPRSPVAATLSESSERVLDVIGFEPTPVEKAVQRSGLTANVVCSILLALELDGHVRSELGGLYTRCGEGPDRSVR